MCFSELGDYDRALPRADTAHAPYPQLLVGRPPVREGLQSAVFGREIPEWYRCSEVLGFVCFFLLGWGEADGAIRMLPYASWLKQLVVSKEKEVGKAIEP